MLFALALQAAPIEPASVQPAPVRMPIDIGDVGRPAAEQRRSVLADACGGTPAATEAGSRDDIVVCGGQQSEPRLPDSDHRGPPTGPQPSNPNMTGAGALAAQATPCAATQRGCPGGLNVLAIGAALVKAVKGDY